MQYYPKSQIKTNLYTNGGELVYAQNQTNYTGFYFKISTGHLYTGKNPSNEKNFRLIPINGPDSSPFSKDLEIVNSNLNQNLNQTITLVNDGITYPDGTLYPLEFGTSQYQNSFKSRIIPTPNLTYPTEQDRQNGYFTRYFCKKTNELIYLEIDKNTFTQLQNKESKIAWDLYTPASIIWNTRDEEGLRPFINTNYSSVLKIEKDLKWYGFSQYFKNDFTKYYENLNNLTSTNNSSRGSNSMGSNNMGSNSMGSNSGGSSY